ncbi:MAG: NTP transferase domain-containing protein [Planctomycetes bacterium]|nr:NTP transferase domain-containing protein [Planctomycetota bacterium]
MSLSNVVAVILAAGKSVRMQTERPKVLHEVCGRPMLAYVIDACRRAGIERCIVVVGFGKEAVKEAFADDPNITWVEQTAQKGTGHAVMCCREQLADGPEHAVVLCGDGPLIRAKTIGEMLERHETGSCSATLATAILEDPSGYGRIVRDEMSNLIGIVEHVDCNRRQRSIEEINPSYYCFRVRELLSALTELRPNNIKGEFYLTDVVGILIERGLKVEALTAVPPEDIFSINSREELARVNRVMRERVNERLMAAGVTIVDPQSTWIDIRAEIGADTVIHPFVYISGPAKIGRACQVGPFARVTSGQEFGDNAVIGPNHGGAA